MTTQNTADNTREKARETTAQFQEGAKDSARHMAEQTREAWKQAREEPTPTGIQGALENLPASAYLYATVGSMGLSLLLRLMGRKDFANFVGLWPPTIVALALMNKQIKPSREM
ncbi:MAG: hypothetical protein HYX51_07150 [Chloroflexi bacterium]|nr:hypothetical protein [Chloroflexota bacterium]